MLFFDGCKHCGSRKGNVLKNGTIYDIERLLAQFFTCDDFGFIERVIQGPKPALACYNYTLPVTTNVLWSHSSLCTLSGFAFWV